MVEEDMKPTDFKNIKKRDLLFSALIIFLTAFFLLVPSRMVSKGTSPGMSALNAILLIGKCTEVVYEKYEPEAVATLFESLSLDLDNDGINFWKRYILERYAK